MHLEFFGSTNPLDRSGDNISMLLQYSWVLTTFIRGLQSCCLGRRGRAPLNGSSKCLNYPRTLYKYQFFTARYLIFDHSAVSPDPRAEGVLYSLRYTQTWGAPLSRTIFMGNESNPSKAVQTIMTRSSLNWVPMSPDIKTNDKDPFQAIFFTILILIVGIQHHPASLLDDFQTFLTRTINHFIKGQTWLG